MTISLKDLEQAVAIRRQINSLEQRLASLIGNRSGETDGVVSRNGRRGVSPATRAKLAAAAKARWARMRSNKNYVGNSKRKSGLTAAGRRRLSQLMKTRWAARKKSGRKN